MLFGTFQAIYLLHLLLDSSGESYIIESKGKAARKWNYSRMSGFRG